MVTYCLNIPEEVETEKLSYEFVKELISELLLGIRSCYEIHTFVDRMRT